MSVRRAAEPAPTPLDVLDQAVDFTCGSLALAATAPLSASTPCADWDLGQLLEHLADSLAATEEAAQTGQVRVAPVVLASGRDHGELLCHLLRQRAAGVREAWRRRVTSAPITVEDIPLDRDVLLAAAALEIAVHGWDVARACGQRRSLPSPLAAALGHAAPYLIGPRDRPGRFAPPLPVAPLGPAPGARLLAFLGRAG